MVWGFGLPAGSSGLWTWQRPRLPPSAMVHRGPRLVESG
ncbi:hypothetical protein L841_4300 [Mycobacterium sp. MAC_080597_8934]|nr:hypothetical protein L842_0783 [Mycobacterium intracellulare MIN_052511_1280]ETZ60136.1 hypothetical protein L841_4303 [Mycobacterium sp. MAC_080597_8934]ETZ60162.1 hypothetical protein L841_4300 [Mycobacterium sp. MAC_080597_8934]